MKYLEVLKNRHFMMYLTGQIVSVFSDLTAGLYYTRKTASSTSIALVFKQNTVYDAFANRPSKVRRYV